MESLQALLEELKKEEEQLQFEQFNYRTAYELGMQMTEEAYRRGLSIVIDICKGEQQLFHHALPGTSKDNDEWVRRKNRVVNRFLHSSYRMGIYYKLHNTDIREKSFLDPMEYAPHGGAFPIIVRNAGVIGTVTVSGLPQKEDHEFVVGMLRRFLKIEL
ncbi:heme-degrading domain-containing protein [Cohnella candidum]|uniref:UPF0303 protein EAV92_10840 n=1 Tax=Cohnella candidum TaxID=2674991 RepID=A0A3G3JXP6_9BACL|nr:heme-degrading domain-containing protein [Cohnella candidum]AYQ73016.1 heme-degrading domain-containing protein [Cohnella candidum]